MISNRGWVERDGLVGLLRSYARDRALTFATGRSVVAYSGGFRNPSARRKYGTARHKDTEKCGRETQTNTKKKHHLSFVPMMNRFEGFDLS